MDNLGELELNLTVKVVSARTFPARPECGYNRPFVAVDEIEIYDMDTLIESDELKAYVFKEMGGQLEIEVKKALDEMKTESNIISVIQHKN